MVPGSEINRELDFPLGPFYEDCLYGPIGLSLGFFPKRICFRVVRKF